MQPLDCTVLIVGLGSIGRRHLANLRNIKASNQIVVWRQPTKNAKRKDNAGEVDHVVYRLEDALEAKPDVALITNPASLHIKTALVLAHHGVHLFIEKPLSKDLDGVNELLDLCCQQSLVLMVGYNLRFYQPIQVIREAIRAGRIGRPLSLRAEVGQYLPDWRPGKDYRQSVSARKALGGGAVLELSHELDYVRWLLGEVSAISAQIGKLSDLQIDVEDTAEIILQFDNGAIGSIHLDMVDRAGMRKCRIIGTEGTIVWDSASNCVQIFSSATNKWSDLLPATAINRNDMYLAELRHFFDCIRNNMAPIVSGDDGHRVMQIVQAVKQSAKEKRMIEL